MRKKLQILTVEEVQYLAHSLAQEKLGFNEPIPDFSTRYQGKLESCLATPFQKFDRKSLYSSFIRKVSVMFYLMIKNHPFKNGNKRIAMTSVFVLLYKNDKWMKVDNKELYNFAVWVAESNPKLRNQVIDAIEKFFDTYVVDFK